MSAPAAAVEQKIVGFEVAMHIATHVQRVHGLTKVETAGYAMLPLALGGVAGNPAIS